MTYSFKSARAVWRENGVWLCLFVLFVRFPILFPLWCLIRAADVVEAAGEWLAAALPALKDTRP